MATELEPYSIQMVFELDRESQEVDDQKNSARAPANLGCHAVVGCFAVNPGIERRRDKYAGNPPSEEVSVHMGPGVVMHLLSEAAPAEEEAYACDQKQVGQK